MVFARLYSDCLWRESDFRVSTCQHCLVCIPLLHCLFLRLCKVYLQSVCTENAINTHAQGSGLAHWSTKLLSRQKKSECRMIIFQCLSPHTHSLHSRHIFTSEIQFMTINKCMVDLNSRRKKYIFIFVTKNRWLWTA